MHSILAYIAAGVRHFRAAGDRQTDRKNPMIDHPPGSTGDVPYELADRAVRGTDREFRQSPFAREVAVVQSSQGVPARVDLLRRTLSRLLQGNREKIDELDLPESVRDLIRAEFRRIGQRIEAAADDYFDLADKSLRCDFRIAGFSRVSAGVEYFESSGLPRSLCVRGGVAQGVRFLRMLRRTGGVKPFYETHLAVGTDNPMAFFRRYSLKARAETYRNIAACLEINPACRGMMTSSWWFDPQLEQISPRLVRLGDIMLQNGALLFRFGQHSNARRHALANSPARQELYDQGKYRPTEYFIVWPRDRLIAWARES